MPAAITIDALLKALKCCPQAVSAQLMGVSVPTVRSRIAQGVWVDKGQGRTDIIDALKHERSARRSTGGGDELRAIKTKREILAYQKELSEVIALADAIQAQERVARAVGAALNNLASRMRQINGERDPDARMSELLAEIDLIRDITADGLQQELEPPPDGGEEDLHDAA